MYDDDIPDYIWQSINERHWARMDREEKLEEESRREFAAFCKEQEEIERANEPVETVQCSKESKDKLKKALQDLRTELMGGIFRGGHYNGPDDRSPR
ncbi:uncharacterized protein JCM6883_000041 [Sporobolomyces salmoneus]|uniref:uncharacterized protein n=1 Tax=Sporobolomyces salmoneus TaxID=183962 RepID=UPI00316E1BC6